MEEFSYQELRLLPEANRTTIATYLGVIVTVAGLFLRLDILSTVPARVTAAAQFLWPTVEVAV